LLLWPVGAGGVFVVVVVLGLLALGAMAAARDRAGRVVPAVLGVLCLGAVPFLDTWYPVPGKIFLDVTKDYTVKTYGRAIYSRWSANSRIDALPMPGGSRFLQMRGSVAL